MIQTKRKSRIHHAWIALGSNLGQRRETIELALTSLRSTPEIGVDSVSALIETDPVGGPPGQPRFLNGAAELSTSLSPNELLNCLLLIERKLGRNRVSAERNTPRPIDLDVLLYDTLVVNEANLIIPHPRMHEREFVLRPLAEIAPGVVHPVFSKTIRELLSVCTREF